MYLAVIDLLSFYSWVRQFIDMQGLQVITDLLRAFNKSKSK